MASSKRMQANNMPSFFLPISKHGVGICNLQSLHFYFYSRCPQESTPKLLKSQLGPLKRGRNVATDGVVASSSMHPHTEPVAILRAFAKTESDLGHESPSIPLTPSTHPVDKKMKSEPSELVPSNTYLQMPSR
jgi:hypothetical protein